MKLKSLQSTFDSKIFKRNNEWDALKTKIRQIEANLQKQSPHCAENKSSVDISLTPSHPQSHADIIKKYTLDVQFENMDHNVQLLLMEQLSKQQEKFEKKMQDIMENIENEKYLFGEYENYIIEYCEKKI